MAKAQLKWPIVVVVLSSGGDIRSRAMTLLPQLIFGPSQPEEALGQFFSFLLFASSSSFSFALCLTIAEHCPAWPLRLSFVAPLPET